MEQPTFGGQAMNAPGPAPALALADLGVLLVAPLAVAALGRQRKWQRWPLAGLLLAVGLLSTGTALAAGDDAAVQEIVRPSAANRAAGPHSSSPPILAAASPNDYLAWDAGPSDTGIGR